MEEGKEKKMGRKIKEKVWKREGSGRKDEGKEESEARMGGGRDKNNNHNKV